MQISKCGSVSKLCRLIPQLQNCAVIIVDIIAALDCLVFMVSGGREIKNSTCCLSQLKVHFTQAAGVKCTAVVQLYQARIKGGMLELELTCIMV